MYISENYFCFSYKNSVRDWHEPACVHFKKLSVVGGRPFFEPQRTSDKIGWSDFRRGSSLPSAPSTTSTMFSKLKSGTSSVSQGAQILATNNILNLFEVGKLVCSAGPELIWKVYEGFRKPDGKVRYIRLLCYIRSQETTSYMHQSHVNKLYFVTYDQLPRYFSENIKMKLVKIFAVISDNRYMYLKIIIERYF